MPIGKQKENMKIRRLISTRNCEKKPNNFAVASF